MKQQYKKLIPFVLCLLVVFSAAMLVSAYFSDANRENNAVTPADNTTEISEEYVPPAEQTVGDNDYMKKITVVNQSNAPCYIRVYADFSDSNIRSHSSLSNDGVNFYPANRDLSDEDTYVSRLPEVAPGWTFIADDDPGMLKGFYYYTAPVPTGQSTEPLFSYVRTYNETNDEIRQYDIVVYSESIQLTDDNGERFADFRQAWETTLARSN